MSDEVFGYMYRRLKERQIKFYAFLNKEFNVLNYKSAKCSYHCFDDLDQSVMQANECLALCREGIVGCRDFASRVQ